MVLDQTIQGALSKFDAKFGYAESFDAPSNSYSGLIYAKTAPDVFGPSALIVRAEVALEHLRREPTGSQEGFKMMAAEHNRRRHLRTHQAPPLLWFSRDRHGSAGEII